MRRSKELRRQRIREDRGLSKPRWYERSWFKIVELLAIVIGVGAITYEVWQRETVDRPVAEATLRELEASERERARAVIASATATTAEKIGALHALVLAGRTLSFLDASCPIWEAADDRVNCSFNPAPVDFLRLAYDTQVRLTNFRMEDVYLQVPSLRNWNCDGCYLRNLRVDGGEMTRLFLYQSDLSGAWLFPTETSSLLISQSNVSNLRFQAGALTEAHFSNAWYFDGQPPIVHDHPIPLMHGPIGVWEHPGRPLSDEEAEALGVFNCRIQVPADEIRHRRPPTFCDRDFVYEPVQ